MRSVTKALVFSLVLLCSARSYSQIDVGVSFNVGIAPPELPVYVQPACPYDGYLWTPGYWAYGDDGYYWVPGVWVAPPTVGYLWTPGYWGFNNGHYGWYRGYWGPHVGFYGGVNYGFGYGGIGFGGGMWQGGHFRYNTAVVNVNTTVIHNTYIDRTVINNTVINNTHVSYNGGTGIHAEPTAQERVAMNEHHVAATSLQVTHEHTASLDKSLHYNVNHGKPAYAAMSTVKGTHYSTEGKPVTVAATHTATAVHNTAHPATTVHPTVNHTTTPAHPATTTHPTVHHTTTPVHSTPVHTAAPVHSAPKPPVSQTHSAPPKPVVVQHPRAEQAPRTENNEKPKPRRR